jgi:Phage tail lysozyme
MTARQQQAMTVFVREGLAPLGAAAAVGALTGESGPNLDSTVFRVNADHGSGGIAEWRLDRKAAMISFVKMLGKPIEDLEGQCLFVINELERDYQALNAELRAGTKTITTMCWNFVTVFERPNMAVAHMDDIRVPQAIQTYNAYIAANHRTFPPITKGGAVIGTAAGGGAIATAGQVPTWATIAMAAASALSYLISANNVKPKPAPLPVPDAPALAPAPAPLSPLDDFKAALDELRACQLKVEEKRKIIVDEVEKMSSVLNSIDVKIIEHQPEGK